jgi:gliding motility-associated-like protein
MKNHIKNLLIFLFLLLNVTQLKSQVGTAGCPNADFSMMNFTNWIGSTGSCCPINLPNTAIDPNRHVITTIGTDQIIGALPTVPPGKSTAARLGNSAVGAQAEALSYTFWVNPMNALFMYEFAVVLEDAGHPATSQARFELQVRNQFGNVIPCTNYLVAASQNIPGFQSQGIVRWRPWTRVGVDLLAQMGQQVTIEARTGDCAWSGHYGYGYIFAECSPMQINVDYCVGDTTATMVAPAGFSSYVWRLQGNTTIISTSQTLVINNVNVGTNYECTITSVMGCSATLAAVLNPVTPVPGFTTMNLCDGMLQFTDITVVPNSFVSQWNWNFGDGTTSTAQSPTHIYTNSGTYNVTLIATAPAGCTDTVTLPVTVPPGIVASFGYNQGCGLTKTFTDMSTIGAPGQIVSWNWSFGDGASSTIQNPTHTYATPGVYNVQLLVGDADGCSKTTNQFIFINANPVASFIAPQTCHGTATPFSNMTTLQGGNTMSHQWSFGNGQSSNAVNPIITYSQPGTYTVTLISTGPGSCSDTFSNTIVVVPSPQASFTLPTPCGLSQPITNTSSILPPGVINQYQWSFGNNVTSNLQNPSTNYTLPGTYNISLIVTSADGCVSSVAQQYTVYAIPVAGYNAAQVCHGSPTPFNTTSTIVGFGPLTYSWNFGNGSSSTAPSPVYTYPLPGTYNTTMVVTGPGGCTDTATQTVLVSPTPVANFQIPPICGLVGVMQNTSTIGVSGVISTYTWNLGNGQILTTQNAAYNYTSPGQYNVTLTVSTAQGCSHSITQLIQVQAVPQVSFNAPPSCHPLPITFTNNTTIQNSTVSSWNWSFGDGGTSNSANPIHSYATHGTYTVTLIANASGLCSDTLTQIVNVSPTPFADFNIPDSCGLIGQLQNTSIISPPDIITSYLWDLGNGQTSNQPNANYSYVNPGVYNVTLIVNSNQGCLDTITKPITIWSVPNAQFTHTPNCYGLPFTLTDQSVITNSQITGWNWSFGDGQSSNLQNPTHIYSTNGQYTVRLIVIGQGGCTDTISDIVTIYPKPIASFALPDSCGMSATFTDLSLSNIVSRNWSFGDGNVSNQNNPTHTYQTNGTYQVRLIVQNTNGCLDTLVQEYRNYHIPVANIITSNNCLFNPTIVLDNSTVQNSQISTWNWVVNNIIQTNQNFNHILTSSGLHIVNLIVTSVDGCVDSINGQFEIYPLPFVSFTSTNECDGDSVTFTNLSNGAVTYEWYLNGNLFSTIDNPKNTYSGGQHQIQLIGTNQYGCQDSSSNLLTIHPRPIPSFGGKFEGCVPLQVFLDNQTSISNNGNITSYIWSIGLNTYYTEDVTLTYSSVGNYSVTLTAISDKGCDSTITFIDVIKTYPLPVAEFEYSPENPNTANTKVEFTNLSQGNLYNTWVIMSQLIKETNISYTFPADTGEYLIYLQVENEYGCTDSVYHPIYINSNFTIFIPNSFTPNKDRLNDSFKIYGIGIVEAEMLIFNRWGELLSSYKNLEPINKGWDGKHNGSPVKQDIYVYKIKVRDFNGKWHDFTGRVNLLN